MRSAPIGLFFCLNQWFFIRPGTENRTFFHWCKSQSEAAEIGKRIYEAAKDDETELLKIFAGLSSRSRHELMQLAFDLEEKEKLLKEYDRLINLGNLQK